jgi:hypothetical protein
MRFHMLAVILLAAVVGGCGGDGDDGRTGGPGPGPVEQPGDDPNDPSDPPGGGGGLSCSEVIECLTACTDASCSNQCIQDASASAQQAILDLANCIDASQCQDDGCLQEKCGAELNACLEDGQ